MGFPTDDPRNLLYAAARWMTAIGWICAPFGFLCMFTGSRAWQVALTGGGLLAAGALLVISAAFARRHRRWAVWLGIGPAALIAVTLALLLMLLVVRVGWYRLLWLPQMALAAVLLLVCLFVHVMIVWNLAKSFEALGAPPANGSGFEPVVLGAPRPVLLIKCGDAPAAAGSGDTSK
jgi:hypothetical protein